MNQLNTMPEQDTIEWEAARVAAAFDVKDWEKEPTRNVFIGFNMGRLVSWGIHNETKQCTNFSIQGFRDDGCFVRRSREGRWYAIVFSPDNELMARGIYCLGFDDESILSQLPELSAHEKLELRLSMPREFWPQNWINELNHGRKEN